MTKTPGTLFLENLVDVNNTWGCILNDSATRLAISDDIEAEYDVYDWLLEVMDDDDPEVTREDFREFIGREYDELRALFSADKVCEIDAILVQRAIEDADIECFLEIIGSDFPHLLEAMNRDD